MMGQIKNTKLRVDFILIISHEASSGLSHLKTQHADQSRRFRKRHKLMFGLSV